MSIVAQHLTKSFGGVKALDDVSLKVDSGELVALLGPSGSGKTTLLRIIAGLEQVDEDSRSSVRFHDEDVISRTAGQRRVGFVFQHYALFRHMTVFENVAFGLRVQPRRSRPSKREIRERVESLLSLVQLGPYGQRYPWQLSGGQRQRVALARALALHPSILLLDEPFGALDAKVRQELRQWLRNLHDQMHVTTVLVTHDQEEALEVADKIVVMRDGRVEQHGTPSELFHQPASPFVMEFLGRVNVFHGRVSQGKATAAGLCVDYPHYEDADERPASVYLRPYEFAVRREGENVQGLPATVQRVQVTGSLARVTLLADGGRPVLVEMPVGEHLDLRLREQELVYLYPKQARVFVSPESPSNSETTVARVGA